MPIRHRTLAWLPLIVLLVPALAAAERQGRLLGKVLDPQGKPLEGVTVTATSPQIRGYKDVQTTDKKGMFTLDFDTIDVTYEYRFDKPGFQSMEVKQEWHEHGSKYFEWTMNPGQSAALSAGPAASTSAPAITAYNGGVAAFKAKDYVTAAARFQEAVGNDPNLRQAWEALASAHFEMGQNKEAAEAAEKAVALGSKEESVLMTRWKAYRNLKDDAKADAALKDMERIGRQTEEAKKFHNEGVALTKAGDFAGAFAKYQEALALDPNLAASQLGYANAALKIGKNAEAAAMAETMLKADPKNEQAIRIRYNACLGLGDKAKLIDALVSLAAIDPVRARDGLLRFAFDAYDANDMPLAKERFGKVIEVDPNYALSYYYLGLINVGLGASADARASLEKFLQLAPNDKEADSARDMLKYLSKP